MIDINKIIEQTAAKTGHDPELVEKVLRNMFDDVQKFMSQKKGYNIQIPNVGTFVFRHNAIPNYARNQKGRLVHWIGRLLIGEKKNLPKTIYAAKDNIAKAFDSLQKVVIIKEEFIEKHARYKEVNKEYLLSDISTDSTSMAEYIKFVKAQLFSEKGDAISDEDLRQM